MIAGRSEVDALCWADRRTTRPRLHPDAPDREAAPAAIRMLGDWLVVNQVLPANPAAATSWPVAGGEDGGEIHRAERPRLAPVAGAGGPPGGRRGPGPSVPRGSGRRRGGRPGSHAAATAVEALARSTP